METTESTAELRIEARPGRSYWLSYLFVMPLAGLVLSAMTIGVVTTALGRDVLQHVHMMEIFVGWTLAAMSFALYIDFRKPYFTLTSHSLQIGTGRTTKIIGFEEIESIVIGLPEKTPWWFRVMCFHPHGRGNYEVLMRQRRRTVLIRLTGCRYVPFNIGYIWMHNGQELMAAFVHLNSHKIADPATYTDLEKSRLGIVRNNAVLKL